MSGFSYFLYKWKSKKIFIAYLSSIRTAEKPQTFYRLRLLFYLAFGRSVFFKSADYTPPTALLTIRQFSRLCRQLLFLRFYAPLQFFNIFRRRQILRLNATLSKHIAHRAIILQVFTHRSSRRIGTNLMYLVSKRQMLKCMSLMTKHTAPCC